MSQLINDRNREQVRGVKPRWGMDRENIFYDFIIFRGSGEVEVNFQRDGGLGSK